MQMKDITEVSVLYHGAIVGRLRMIKGKCVFEYDKSWLAEGFSIQYPYDVLKAGTGIRISKNRCLDIVGEIQTICAQHLEHTVNLLD